MSTSRLWVIVNSIADTGLTDLAGQMSPDLTFTGDDAVELKYCGITIDVIGRIGEDPGSYWGASPATTQDYTLRRKMGVTTGDRDGSESFEPSIEWEGFAQDTFDGLGSR